MNTYINGEKPIRQFCDVLEHVVIESNEEGQVHVVAFDIGHLVTVYSKGIVQHLGKAWGTSGCAQTLSMSLLSWV